MDEVDNNIHQIVYQNFIDSNKHMRSGMILGMYRILGIASVLIGMSATMQEHEDHENYAPLRGVNMYSFLLPIFSILYDAQLTKIMGRSERIFNLYCKYLFVLFYWIFMITVSIIVLKEPWKTVTVTKKLFKDPSKTEIDTELFEESPFPENENFDTPNSNSLATDLEVKDLSENTLFLLKIMNLIILFYPMVACAYSKAIFDCMGFSVP